MDDPRAVVIGVGLIGSLHARIYRDHPQAELVAVVDSDIRVAEQVAEELQVAAYSNLKRLLDEVDFEVASIATPEDVRPDIAIACARAGKHLLLEKPLAPTLREAIDLAAALSATEVHVMVNFLLRFDPRYRRAKELAETGGLGRLRTMSARRRGTVRGAEYYGKWTDLLVSTVIHDLDAMSWITASPVTRVYAEAVASLTNSQISDAVMVMIRFANNVVGIIEASWILPPTAPAALDSALHVVGTGGSVVIEGTNNGLEVVDSNGYTRPDLTHWPIEKDGVGGDLRYAVDHFVRAVRNGVSPQVGLDAALDAQRLAEAAKTSLDREMPVEFPDGW